MSDSPWRRLARLLVPRAVRNALRNPSATVRSFYCKSSFALGRTAVVSVSDSWTLRCHPSAQSTFATTRDVREFKSEMDAFITRCRPRMVFLDIGAHYGAFTLAAAHFSDSARVWAIEPSQAARCVLEANIHLNNAGDRVTTIAAAVGDRDGHLDMLTTGPNGLDFFIAASADRADATRVPLVTLPTLAAKISAPITHLKIDVEGFEAEILSVASDFLRSTKPILFLELHGDILRSRGKDPKAILAGIRECGYDRLEQYGRPVTADAAAAQPIARIVCLPIGAE